LYLTFLPNKHHPSNYKMRFKKSLQVVSLGFFLLSCNSSSKPVLAPEHLPNVGNQKVITSLINKKDGAISIIYGNDLAIKSANNSISIHQIGESYTIVTWKEKAMPDWYGTNMNGEILSIEKVNLLQDKAGKLSYNYKIERGTLNWRHMNVKQRVHHIINQSTAVFP
jgi:hypothetical protein